jgi:hypothetical protein
VGGAIGVGVMVVTLTIKSKRLPIRPPLPMLLRLGKRPGKPKQRKRKGRKRKRKSARRLEEKIIYMMDNVYIFKYIKIVHTVIFLLINFQIIFYPGISSRLQESCNTAASPFGTNADIGLNDIQQPFHTFVFGRRCNLCQWTSILRRRQTCGTKGTFKRKGRKKKVR